MNKNKRRKSIPVPPGNVVYSDELTDLWNKLIGKEERDEVYTVLLASLEKMLRRIAESNDEKIRRIVSSPESSSSSSPSKHIQVICCSLRGLNHKARDLYELYCFI